MRGGAIFVAGIGTEIGKTYVTTALVRSLRDAGRRPAVLKPIASGVSAWDAPAFAASDTAHLLAAAGVPVTAASVAACTPWRFDAALSPDLAASAEGRSVRLDEVEAFCRARLAGASDLTLIEGAGGLMSPLASDGLNLDLAIALGCPVILVAATYLGAISHTLSALAVLHAAGLSVVATVVNATPHAETRVDDTCARLAHFAEARRLPAAFIALAQDAPCPPALRSRVLAMASEDVSS